MKLRAKLQDRWHRVAVALTPPALRGDDIVTGKVGTLLGGAVPMVLASLGTCGYLASALPWPADAVCAGIAVLNLAGVAAMAVAIRGFGSTRRALDIALACCLVDLFALGLVSRDIRSPAVYWIALLPSAAMLLLGRAEGLRWLIGAQFVLLGLRLTHDTGAQYSSLLSPTLLDGFTLTVSAALLLFAVWLFRLCDRTALVARTALQSTHDALEEAGKRAEQANRDKTAFLARMSHELRTPLMAILGYTQLMREDRGTRDTSADDQVAIAVMDHNGAHLLQIVDDVLDLSKIEARELRIDLQSVDALPLVDQVVASLEASARQRRIRLVCEPLVCPPLWTRCDPTRLRQILLNLAGNAIKFTAEGTVTLRLRTASSGSGSRIGIDVEDTGIGMTEEEQSELFDPYAQASRATARLYGGTGLGLSISKHLIECMHGQIRVHSTRGVGTCISLELPVAEAQTALGAQDPGPERARPALEGTTVLVVDDLADNRLLLSHLLARAGATVAVAVDGVMAVQRVSEASAAGEVFDTILMDLQMPEMDGYEAVRVLRAQGYTGRIVALTADALSGTRERCMEVGFDDYATKPIAKVRLLPLVAKRLPEPEPTPVPAPAADPRATAAAAPATQHDELSRIERVTRWFVPEEMRRDPDLLARARTVTHLSLVPMTFIPAIVLMTAWLFQSRLGNELALVTLGTMPFFLAVPLLMRFTRSVELPAHMLFAYTFLIVTIYAFMSGGIRSTALGWYALVPTMAVAVVGTRGATVWTALAMLAMTGLFEAQLLGHGQSLTVEARRLTGSLVSTGLLSFLMYALSCTYDRNRTNALRRLQDANDAIERTRDAATQASDSKGSFLATLSHEMRTPLTAILGYADLLAERWGDTPTLAGPREMLRSIERNGQRLLRRINDLLDLAKLDAGRLELEEIPFALHELLEDALEKVRPRAERKRLQLRFRSLTRLPERLIGDPTRIRQIVDHLLDNAVEFTMRGSIELEAALASGERSSELHLRVVDTGPGLSDEQRQRCFELTARSGLGLLVSWRISQRMAGSLQFETGPQGSAFRVAIPVLVATGTAFSEPGEGLRSSSPLPAAPAAQSLQGIHLLLVDDGPDNRRLIASLLRREGATVEVAESGRHALDIACRLGEELAFDAVLMDLHMPQMDGLQASRELRMLGYDGAVIVLTAERDGDVRERVLAAGCDECAGKPIDRAQLRSAILGSLKRRDPR